MSVEDKKLREYKELIEIIAKKKPNISFLENVVNLITHDKGRTFATIISKIAEVGYKVFKVILNSTFLGIPQNRHKVYILVLVVMNMVMILTFLLLKRKHKKQYFVDS